MRTNVSFQHPAEYVSVSEEDGVLAVAGAQWFVQLLQRIPDLQVDGELCQEDWGVVVLASRSQKQFWIGLSMAPEGEHRWLAHVRHRSFAWLQRFSGSGKRELQRLLSDLHAALACEPAVSAIAWHEESEMGKAGPHSYATPDEI